MSAGKLPYVTLPIEPARMADEKVASGEYANESEGRARRAGRLRGRPEGGSTVTTFAEPAPQAAQVLGLDHVQLAMPPGGEAAARGFYRDLLGLAEVAKPANLAGRGGAWFERGAVRLHLGVETDFRPARKAHPALLVADLAALAARLAKAGHPVRADEPLPGFERLYVDDPFGNRIELMQRTS